jgi:hypothetical protein
MMTTVSEIQTEIREIQHKKKLNPGNQNKKLFLFGLST